MPRSASPLLIAALALLALLFILRVAFPSARIVEPGFPLTSWPPSSDDGPCLLVWQGPAEPATAVVPPRLTAYLTDVLAGDPQAPHRQGDVSAPAHMQEAKLYRISYRLYDRPVGDCR